MKRSHQEPPQPECKKNKLKNQNVQKVWDSHKMYAINMMGFMRKKKKEEEILEINIIKAFPNINDRHKITV